MTQFGQNAAQDPNTVTGWNVQANVGAQQGYAQPGEGVSYVFTGNGSPGAPNPVPGNVTDILANPGYADVNPVYLTPGFSIPASMVPVPATNVVFHSPTPLAATVVITGGTVTSVKTAPLGSATFTQIGTADGTYTVPAGGSIELTYSAAPTWTWTTAATNGAP